MKKIITCLSGMALAVMAIAATTGLAPGFASEAKAQSEDCYRTFYTNGVTMQVCSYRSGSSGFYILENTSNYDREVCWTLVFRDGSESKGCRARFPARSSYRSSCYNCNPMHKGGVANIYWRTNETLN